MRRQEKGDTHVTGSAVCITGSRAVEDKGWLKPTLESVYIYILKGLKIYWKHNNHSLYIEHISGHI